LQEIATLAGCRSPFITHPITHLLKSHLITLLLCLQEIATFAGCRSPFSTHPLFHPTLTHSPHCFAAPAALLPAGDCHACGLPLAVHHTPTHSINPRSITPASAGCLQEIATLAGCRSPFITRYHASLIPPGSSQLLIVMELLLGSVADAVRGMTGV
jgi:AraC-like DNA-binding protein